MGEKDLNKEQRATHRFLKGQVDKLIDEERRTNAHPNVQQDLHRAREALKQFVEDLRKLGMRI